MSIVVRRKHVLKEMMEDDFESPTQDQQIVRILGSRGNNLHEVETAAAEKFLVSMPNKFRRNIWVKRGDYVLVENIEEGVRVKGEICKILTPEHVKEYTKAGVWPKEFVKKCDHEQIDMDSDENGDELLMRNPNRPTYKDDDHDSCIDEDDDSCTDEDDNANNGTDEEDNYSAENSGREEED